MTDNGTCQVMIGGTLTRLRPDGARVSVSHGEYTIRERSLDWYEFSGDKLPTFEPTLRDVALYLHGQMKAVEGRWP
jgi:hypothetical protein